MNECVCPECGATWEDDQSCESAFHQFLYWENEGGDEYRAVHHLVVLCYHLQHPHILSADWLKMAKPMLVDFIERGVSPKTIRQLNADKVESRRRGWKIKATADNFGKYDPEIKWKMTTKVVLDAGFDRYPESIIRWADTILTDLRNARQI